MRSLLALLIACGWVESAAQTPPSADLEINFHPLGYQVVAGESALYVVLIRNLGPGAANNVEFELDMPPGTTFESVGSGAGSSQTTCTTPPVGGAGTTRCTRPQLPSGQVISMSLRLRTPPSSVSTFLRADARVSSSTADPQPANNLGRSTLLALRVGAQSDLSVQVVAVPSPVLPGQVLTHEITVTNHGPDPTTEVAVPVHGLHEIGSLTTEVPAGWTCDFVPVGIPPPGFEFMVCSTPFFEVGTATLRVRSQLLPTAQFPNFIGLRVLSNGVDPVSSNNQVTLTTPLGTGSGVPIPTLSPALLALLALLLGVVGVLANRVAGRA